MSLERPARSCQSRTLAAAAAWPVFAEVATVAMVILLPDLASSGLQSGRCMDDAKCPALSIGTSFQFF